MVVKGLVLGRYEKVSLVGKGNFGTVWQCVDLKTGATVAVKFQNLNMVHKQTLANEHRLLVKLKMLDCVPQVIDFGVENGTGVLVLQYLGKDLGTVLKEQRRFPVQTIKRLAVGMLDVMEQVHSHNVVHQDLKPENIMLSKTEPARLYLVDFGISREVQPPSKTNDSKAGFLGTPRYASKSAHREKHQTPKDDLESLGYVLVYLVKLSLPWMHIVAKPKHRIQLIYEKKLTTTLSQLCSGLPQCFLDYLSDVNALVRYQLPNYQRLRSYFVVEGPFRLDFKDQQTMQSFQRKAAELEQPENLVEQQWKSSEMDLAERIDQLEMQVGCLNNPFKFELSMNTRRKRTKLKTEVGARDE